MGSTDRVRNSATLNSTRLVTAGLVMAAGLAATACSAGVSVDSSPIVSTTDIPSVTGAPNTPSSGALSELLARALTQDQSAKASYDNVIAKFGQVPPFSQLAKALAENVSALDAVAQAHGITITGDPVLGSPAAPNLALACQVGVEIEKYSIAQYDELLPQVTAHPDVAALLSNLRTAATDVHLPALQQCS